MTLEIAQKHLCAWLEAELRVVSSQSYTIGTRVLTRANLNAIRDEIKYWRNEVMSLEMAAKGKKRNRVYRIVPRDL